MFKTLPVAAKESGVHRTTLNKAVDRGVFGDAVRIIQEHRGKVTEIDVDTPVYKHWLMSRKRKVALDSVCDCENCLKDQEQLARKIKNDVSNI